MALLNIPSKATNDIVSPAEFNSIVNAINNIKDLLDLEIADINVIQAKTNAFKPVKGTGLSIDILGGVLKRVSDGQVLNIAAQTLFVPSSSTNRWAWIDRNGVAAHGTTLPSECYDLCQFTSDLTSVTSIIDARSPSYEIKQRQTREVLKIVKNGVLTTTTAGVNISGMVVPSDGINEGSMFNLSTGVLTIPKTTKYDIFVRCRISDASRNDAGKLSLYVGATEIRILDTATKSILQGNYSGTFNAGDQVTFKVFSVGGNGQILGDNNTEIIVKMLG